MTGVTGASMGRLAIAGAVVVAVLTAVPQSAAAAVRRVPGSYPTIQAAVDAAGAGDIIDVAPGATAGRASIGR